MNATKCRATVLVLCIMATSAWARPESGDTELRLTVDLVDGSHLVGVPSLASVPVQTSYARFDIPLGQISKIRIGDDHETASFDLRNGDTVSGVLDLGPLELETVFGRITVGIDQIVRLRVSRMASSGDGATDVNADLLLYYDFEDVEAERLLRDKSGNGVHAKMLNGPRPAEGRFGDALDFQGKAYLETESNPTEGLDQFTVALWLKTEDPRRNHKLASTADWRGGSAGSGWLVGTHYAELWGEGDKKIQRELDAKRLADFVPGAWNHLVVVYGGERLTEYVNGKVSRRWTVNGGKIGRGTPLHVGAWPGQGFFYSGLIDEFMIFSRALSADAVADLHRAHAPRRSSDDDG